MRSCSTNGLCELDTNNADRRNYPFTVLFANRSRQLFGENLSTILANRFIETHFWRLNHEDDLHHDGSRSTAGEAVLWPK
jgi:hypothetical protein